MDRKKMMLAIGVGGAEFPEFDIPEAMDVTEIKDGDEKEIVAKVRRNGDKFSLIEVNGITLGESDDDQTEDWEDEEDYENEASEIATDASEIGGLSDTARSAGLI